MAFSTDPIGVAPYDGTVVTASSGTIVAVAGSAAWVWGEPTAALAEIEPLAGSDAWSWSTSGNVAAVRAVVGSGAWAWSSNGYLVSPPPNPVGPSGGSFTPIPVVAGLPDLNTRLKPIQRVSPAMPNTLPTLGPTGRPARDSFVPVVTRADWGYLQLVVGGQDVTYFRSVPATVESWESAEPFDDLSLVVTFKQISYFGARGTGNLVWLKDFADVQVWHINPDGTRDTSAPIFEGLVSSYAYKDGALEVTFLGSLHQAGFYVRAPSIDATPVDIGNQIAFNFANNQGRPAIRFNNMVPVATGFLTQYRGKWETVLEYVNKLLQQTQDPVSGGQWTVLKTYPNTPVLKLKDTTTVQWSITPGTAGTTPALTQELTTNPTHYYGEGIDEARARWQNSYLNANGDLLFVPLAGDPAGIMFTIDGNGHPVQEAGFDPTRIRHEVYQNYGQSVSLTDAQKSAQAQLNSFLNLGPGWVGTIDLEVDPEEGSRLMMRAGQNIRLRYFEGSGYAGTIFHIAHVKATKGEGNTKVTLTVDTKARDIQTVAAIIQRDRENANKSVQRLLAGKDTALTQDATAVWDAAGGSGVVPTARFFNGTSKVPCYANQWNYVKVRMSEEDSVIRTAFYMDNSSAIFHVSVYAAQPKADQMPNDPFAVGAWDGKVFPLPDYYIIGWGSAGQRAGFYPGLESNGDPATGVMVDEATWPYTHDKVPVSEMGPGTTPFLWLAIWTTVNANMYGQMSRGIGSYV